MSANAPRCLLVLSGKRKSGKDFLAEYVQKQIGKDLCLIQMLSGPLKKLFAQSSPRSQWMKIVVVALQPKNDDDEENGLDLDELLNSSLYKENYRHRMIILGENIRFHDPYFFCRKIIEEMDMHKPVWIISDARRLTDVKFFREHYTDVVKFVRVCANDEVRQQRGFVFTPGIDDAESECGLDNGVVWDFTVHNDGNEDQFNSDVSKILEHVKAMLV